MSTQNFPLEISVIFPSRNEGGNVAKVLDELIFELESLGRSYEIIALDSPSKNPSFPTFKEYADKYENFYAIDLSYVRAAGSDKAVKYMIGFKMAKGRYIIQMDSDGQDNPADLKLFIDKLDTGTDLVVGYKQNRKDGKIYMLSSKVGNTTTRILTGVNIHDMNCGFKGYQQHVAKSLNIKGRWYRYIPAMASAKGYSIAEVPIENRKRVWGKTNFSFKNRLEGGLFDMGTVILINWMGETPFHFFGWVSLGLFALASVLLLISVFLNDLYAQLMLGGSAIALFAVAMGTVLMAIMSEVKRAQEWTPIEEYSIREIYSKGE